MKPSVSAHKVKGLAKSQGKLPSGTGASKQPTTTDANAARGATYSTGVTPGIAMPIQASTVQFQLEQEEREQDQLEEGAEVQMKCSACEAELTEPPQTEASAEQGEVLQHKCAACEATEQNRDEVQAKADSISNQQGNQLHVLKQAREGLRHANSPLPHRERIQRSFGHHDISAIRTETGGVAGQASKHMGALAYTSGNRIGFRQTPDLHLAAHEAAHVVQQRQGVSLKDAVGSPGDPYEQHADEVADHVVSGESAEDLLSSPQGGDEQQDAVQQQCDNCEGGTSANTDDEEPLQMQLEVNAHRLFEDGAGSTVENGGTSGGTEERDGESALDADSTEDRAEDESEGESGTPESESSESDTAEDTNTDAASSDAGSGRTSSRSDEVVPDGGGGARTGAIAANAETSATDSSAPSSATGATTTAPAGAGTATGQSCTPECYDAPSDQPAIEPEQAPSNPPQGQVDAEASEGNEEDLPEIDDCPPSPQGADGAAEDASSEVTGSGSSEGVSGTDAGEDAGVGDTAAASAMSGGGGGGTVAGVGGETMSHGSPMDGVIASAEAQRTVSVAAYADSSAVLSGADSGVQMLRQGIRFRIPAGESIEQQQQRIEATRRADSFFGGVADHLDEAIGFALNDIPHQLGAAAESAKAQIAASMEQQKTTISAQIAQARATASTDAAMAHAAVSAQAATYIADVEAATSGAIGTLTATHAATMTQVDDLETSTLEEINEIYAQGRTDLENLGGTMGDECTTTGEDFASQYEGFRDCTEDGFWDGNLSERRANAQATAAREVAGRYKDRMVDGARKRAREVTQNGRKADRCAIIASASKSRSTLDQHLPSLISALESTRDSAIQQAGVKESSLHSSIDSSLASTLSQLDQQEHTQRQAVNDTGYMQQVLQEQIAHAAAAAVQQGVSSAVESIHLSMQLVQARLAEGETPAPGSLDRLMTQAEQRIDAAMSGLQTSASLGATTAEAQLADALQQTLSSLEGITANNSEQTGTLSSSFTASMSAIAGTDNYASDRTTLLSQIDQATTAGNETFTRALDALQQTCDEKTTAAVTTLEEAYTSLEENLTQGKQGLECEITRTADEAASKEPPAWKQIIAAALVIIVVVIIIAVIVVTAGAAGPVIVAALGGPILAGIIIGAAVGAVTSGLLAVASNLANNREWTRDVGKAILIGAVTGALGGGFGAAAGAGAGALFSGASQAVQTAAQFGAAMLSAGTFDVITQYVMGGFSFDHFSAGQLGFTLLITMATFGLGHYVSTRANVAGVRPTETPEGTPTTHADTPESIPTPTDTPESIPTPTDTPEPIPTPTDTPEPAPTPTDTPESTPTPTDTPESTPTPADTPEGTRPAEPTPEEIAVLENTSNKSGDELSPSEITTEREVARRTEGEPVNDPPFTQEHELPNGHTLEETPDGNLSKRCSPSCGIYDAEGRLIGEANPPEHTPTADTPEGLSPTEDFTSLTDAELRARIDETPKTNNPADEGNRLRYERYRRSGGTKYSDYDSWFNGSRGGRPGSPEHQTDVASNNGPPNNLEPRAVGNRVPDGVGEAGQSVVIRGQKIEPVGNGRVIVESDHVVYNGTMPNSEARAQMRAIRAADPNATLVVTDLSNPSAAPLIYPPGTQPPPPGNLPTGQNPRVPFP